MENFTVEFEFTSTKAYGENYTMTRVIRAKNAQAAIVSAKLIGFSEFGARFTDNCVDWRILKG